MNIVAIKMLMDKFGLTMEEAIKKVKERKLKKA